MLKLLYSNYSCLVVIILPENDGLLNTLPDRINKIFDVCSKDEQKILLKILYELSETGDSETYKTLWLADYKEIPVDIDTFINADAYLGRTNRNGDAVYPFWRKELQAVFASAINIMNGFLQELRV